MKYKFLLVGILFLTQFQLFSQDPRLFETTWYLSSIELNGETIFPPSNEEVPFVALDFSESDGLETKVCDILSGTLDFNSGPFIFLSNDQTTLGCDEPDNITFQSEYLDDFFLVNIDNSFSYGIIKDPGFYTLIISVPNGDQAFYTSKLLSSSDLTISDFVLFPNPTENYIYLPSNWSQKEIHHIKIYDSSGKLMSELKNLSESNKIDLAELANGIYFLKATDRMGHIKFAKFIKD